MPTGDLYVATQRGIALFDGYRFIKNDSIQNTTLSIFQDLDELYFFDSNALQSTKYIHEKPKIIVNTIKTDNNPNNDHFENIFVDSKKRIWTTDFEHVKFINPKTKKIHSFPILRGNKNLRINLSILEIRPNEIWVFAPNGIWMWKEGSSIMIKWDDPIFKNIELESAKQLKNKNIIFSSSDGKLFQINSSNQKISAFTILPEKEMIIGFEEFGSSQYYLSSSKVYEIKNGQIELIFQTDQPILRHINVDRNSRVIWISSSKGLIKLQPIHPNLTNWKFDSSTSPIISICEDHQNRIWAVNSFGEIWKIEHQKSSKVPFNNSGKIFGIYDAKGEIILTTSQGIYHLQENRFQILPIQIDTNHEIISTILTPQNEFWVVYSTKEMDRYKWPSLEKINRNIQNDSSFWSDNKWQDIKIDHNNRIWLVGWMPKSFGITYYQPEKEAFYDIADKKLNPKNGIFVGDYFTKIGLGNHNKMLFTAYGGWNETDQNGKLLKRFDINQHRILDSHLRGIASDENNAIFFATGEGLHVYRPELDQVFRFSKQDGFPTDYLVNSFYATKDGRILLGVEGGISEFSLKNSLHSQLQNKLNFSQILINGIPISSLEKELVLNKNQRDLLIQFSDYSFLSDEKGHFRYQFSDDEKWHDLEKPELIFNHISPGKYQIEFEAIDNLGNIQKQKLNLSIHAKPPFLKSNIFYGLLILGIFALIFGINQYLWKKRHEKQEDLRKIKEAEMKTLRSQMNPHFLFNTLNSINSYIIQNKTEDASSYLTTFSKLMRNILDNSKYEQITLKNELDSLKLYLTLESVRLEHSFDYVFKIDSDINQESILVPPLIIQPFAENSIWHGLRNLTSGGILEIIAKQPNEETLVLKIQDNGIGREESAKLKKNETQHKSYGIAITIDRIKSLNPENSVEIIDLYQNEKPSGTIVLLTLKLKEND